MAATRVMRAVQEIGEGVWFVEGPASNWVIVHRPDQGIALIDAGYPADGPLVVDSIRTAGLDPACLRAVFITHAHTDHIGGIPHLLQLHPTLDVLAAPGELTAVHGPERDQITVKKAGLRLLRPRFVRWAVDAIRAGGKEPLTLPTARTYTNADLDRWGLTPMHSTGHTVGSVSYQIGSVAIATGDALVTDHPTYRKPRTGAIAAVFSSDVAIANVSATLLASQPGTLLPGHGPQLPDHNEYQDRRESERVRHELFAHEQQ